MTIQLFLGNERSGGLTNMYMYSLHKQMVFSFP